MARRGSLVLAVLAALVAGCGSASEPVTGGAGAATAARGTLAVALPDAPTDLDPLFADTRSEQLVVRQMAEPLIESLAGPYDDVRRRPGLALGAHASDDSTIWRVPLRTGVRFQDGTLLNASAVLVNVERWLTTDTGRALLPTLAAADAPRPDLVRLFCDRPTPGLPELLSSPRLAVLSPEALHPHSGTGAVLRPATAAGTGPFELRERSSTGLLVARNLGWWGSDHGLGPALDQVDFRVVPDSSERLGLLRAGAVQVADRLAPNDVRRLRSDPLLVGLPGPGGTALGLERSVRGILNATEIPSFSGVWLTRIGAG